jgi:putative NADH-flavin reductase
VGGEGVLNFDEATLLLEQENYPQEYLAVSNEHLKAYEYLKESNVDWTFVCPPSILPTQATGSFTTQANYVPAANKSSITAGDIALFMLKEMNSNAYVKQRVGISN